MRALLFDKDGTLLDFQASWSAVYRELALELAGGDGAAAQAMLVSGGMHPDTGAIGSGTVLAAGNTVDIVEHWFPALAGADKMGMVRKVDAAFYANGLRHSAPLPGVAETLAELAAAGFAMGVATSDGTAGSRAALAAIGLGQYLPHIFGYDSVPRPKPAPDIVHAFAEATGTPEREIAVIGDNPHDLEMARSAGAGAAIGVLSGTGEREHLAPLADALLDSICDLPAWLAARPADVR